MILGFTGPRGGMSTAQIDWTAKTFIELQPTEFHHGACTGCDGHAHRILRANVPGCRIIVHPPLNERFLDRWCIRDADMVLPAKGYHERDWDITEVCEMMISTPLSEPYPSSGTWLTINYALTQHKPVKLCYPDGTEGQL